MKITLKALAMSARSLAVQSAAVLGSLTALAGSLMAAGVVVPPQITAGLGIATVVTTWLARAIPQGSVASYNPQTHDVVERSEQQPEASG